MVRAAARSAPRWRNPLTRAPHQPELLAEALARAPAERFCFPLPDEWNTGDAVVMNLTLDNPEMRAIDVTDPVAFSRLVDSWVVTPDGRTRLAIGRYAENRNIYQSELFVGVGTPRSMHLGIDLNAPAGVPVRALLDGTGAALPRSPPLCLTCPPQCTPSKTMPTRRTTALPSSCGMSWRACSSSRCTDTLRAHR